MICNRCKGNVICANHWTNKHTEKYIQQQNIKYGGQK